MLERTIADVIGYLRQSLRRLPLPPFPAPRFNTTDGIRRLFKLCRYSGADRGTWGHAQWRYLAGRRLALGATMRAAPGAIGTGGMGAARAAPFPWNRRPASCAPAAAGGRGGGRGCRRPARCACPRRPRAPASRRPRPAAPGACGRHGCAHSCTRAPPAPGAAECLHDPGSAYRSARRGARRPQHGARPRPGAPADPFIRRLPPPPVGGTAWRSWGGA